MYFHHRRTLGDNTMQYTRTTGPSSPTSIHNTGRKYENDFAVDTPTECLHRTSPSQRRRPKGPTHQGILPKSPTETVDPTCKLQSKETGIKRVPSPTTPSWQLPELHVVPRSYSGLHTHHHRYILRLRKSVAKSKRSEVQES